MSADMANVEKANVERANVERAKPWTKLVRAATEDDNAALCSLAAQVPMTGAMVVSAQRAPDYFALYRLQRGSAEVLLHEEREQVSGTASALFRQGFVAGERTAIGYLRDLRSSGFTRRSRIFPLAFAQRLEEFSKTYDCEHFVATMIADNWAAINAFTSPPQGERRQQAGRSGRRNRPRFALYRRYEAVAVHLLRAPRPEKSPGLTVEVATRGAIDEISAFLAEDHGRRPFGYDFAGGEFEHRLRHWPDFLLEQTYLCRSQAGTLVGVTTAWDPSVVNRYQVEAYDRKTRWANAAYNLCARVTGAELLPRIGQAFKVFYLANLSILDDDPRILGALVDKVYADFFGRGYQFFVFPLYEADPLGVVLEKRPWWGTVVRKMAFAMYRVSAPGAPPLASLPGRPGFEIALA